mgnify:CR=1 FL=1
MSLRLFLGPGQGPIHQQHLDIMKGEGDGWVFVDKYLIRPGWVKMDAAKLTYGDNSVDMIYASHLLEHIPHRQTLSTLQNWYRVLKVNGKVIINVPNFEWACDYFLEKQKNPDYWDVRDKKYYFTKDKLLEIFYGGQDSEGEYHHNGFTIDKLEYNLCKAGFVNISIQKIWDAHDMECIFAEAYK